MKIYDMHKVAIVSGASGNLGKVVVEKFMSEGFKVYGLDRTAHYSSEIDLLFKETNLLDPENTKATVSEIFEAEGRIDAVINLVGGFGMSDIEATTLEDIDKMVALNFKTALNLTQATLPLFSKDEMSNLVFIGAKPAFNLMSAQALIPYALSKSMVANLADIINGDKSLPHVKATVIVPSVIDTPPNREAMPGANFDDWVKPEEIASSIHFVCSDEGKALRETVLKLYNNS